MNTFDDALRLGAGAIVLLIVILIVWTVRIERVPQHPQPPAEVEDRDLRDGTEIPAKQGWCGADDTIC